MSLSPFRPLCALGGARRPAAGHGLLLKIASACPPSWPIPRPCIFRPGTAPDLANELYTVALIDAQGDCLYSTRDGMVHSSLELSFVAARTPRRGGHYSVPYFVAVHENARVFTKRLYTLRFTFAPGASVATIKQAPDDVDIKLANGKLPWNYQMMAGFQMTPAQIDYAKHRARYVP
jgi:hypothetical protein